MEAKNNKVMSDGYNYEKALAQMNWTQDDVNSLRDLVKDFSVVPKSVHDKQLLCFLLEGIKIETAAKRVKLFYEIKVKNPNLFKNRDPESQEIQQCLRSQNFFFLPLTPEGKSVIYLGLIDFRASSWHFDESSKTCLMLCEQCICNHGPSKGVEFLIDMKGATLSHLTKPNIKTIISIIQFAFYACPANIKAIHVLNAPSFFDTIVKLFLKPFIKIELKDLLFLHRPDNNWKEFYTKYIPKSCLPSDYGGDLDSIEVMHQRQCENFISNKEYFIVESEQVFSVKKN